jgi:predicted porin
LYAADGVTPIAAATSPVNNEGASGTKPAYGLYTRYEGTSGMWGYKFGGAYQVDNGSSYATTANGKNAPAEAKRAWILAAATSYGPVKFDLGYAESRIDNNSLSIGAAPLRSGRSKTMFASVGYNITPLDHVYASYGRYQRKNDFNYTQTVTGLPTFSAYGEGEIKGTQISAGYEHRLSKRTLVYTNIRKVFNVTNSCAYTPAVASTSPFYKYSVAVGKGGCAATEGVVSSVLSVEKGWSYDIGLSHSF